MLNDFQKDLTKVLQRSYKYINTPNETERNFISQEFKQLSIMLNVLYDIKKDKKNKLEFDDSIKKTFWQFKSNVTGHTFGSRDVTYSDDNKMIIESCYSTLQRKFSLSRIKLYS